MLRHAYVQHNNNNNNINHDNDNNENNLAAKGEILNERTNEVGSLSKQAKLCTITHCDAAMRERIGAGGQDKFYVEELVYVALIATRGNLSAASRTIDGGLRRIIIIIIRLN